jgi:hypothetical protein
MTGRQRVLFLFSRVSPNFQPWQRKQKRKAAFMKWTHWLMLAAFVAVVTAVIWRVPKVKQVVVGS